VGFSIGCCHRRTTVCQWAAHYVSTANHLECQPFCL